MATQTGKKQAGRFYVENVDKGFIVPFTNFDIEEETDELVDRLKIKTGRNEQLQYGDEIVVRDNANGEEKVFGGYVTLREQTQDLWKVEIDEYVKETVDKRVKQVFTNQSPESILDDLITEETSLDFFAPVSSGVTLDKYIVEGPIEDAIDDMIKVLDWQLRTEPDREVYF